MSDKAQQGNSLQGTPSPPPCANGCGFFGSPSTMNMCSKCFRESVKAKPTPSPSASPSISQSDQTITAGPSNPAVVAPNPVPALPLPPPPTPPSVHPSESAPSVLATPPQQEQPPRKVQKNTTRCFSCRKKVGLTGFKCHCGYVYCSEHRYSEAHDCDYDYQTSGREQLAKANPVVVASKLDKI